MKILEDMDFDPTVFEINEADVFALEDENLTYENSFDMTWFKNNVQNLRGYLFRLSLPKNFKIFEAWLSISQAYDFLRWI